VPGQQVSRAPRARSAALWCTSLFPPVTTLAWIAQRRRMRCPGASSSRDAAFPPLSWTSPVSVTVYVTAEEIAPARSAQTFAEVIKNIPGPQPGASKGGPGARDFGVHALGTNSNHTQGAGWTGIDGQAIRATPTRRLISGQRADAGHRAGAECACRPLESGVYGSDAIGGNVIKA